MRGVVQTGFMLQNWGRASIALTSTEDQPVVDAQLDQPGVPVAVFLKSSALCDATFTYGAGTGRIQETIRFNGECRRTMLASHVSVVARSVAGTATITGAVVVEGAQLLEPSAALSQALNISVPGGGTATVDAIWRRHLVLRNVGANVCVVRLGGLDFASLAANASVQIDDWRGPVTLFAPALITTVNAFSWGV